MTEWKPNAVDRFLIRHGDTVATALWIAVFLLYLATWAQ